MNRPLTRTQTRTITTIAVVVVVLGGLLGGLHLADGEPGTHDATPVDADDTGLGTLVPPVRPPAIEAHVPPAEVTSGDAGGDTTGGTGAGEAAGSEPEVDPPSEARDGLTDGPGAGPDPDDPAADSGRGSEDPSEEGRPEEGDESGDPGDEGDDAAPVMTLPDGALEPDPSDVGATPTLPEPPPPADCDAGHKQGYWYEYATGASGDLVGFEPFVTDECEGVIVDLAGEVPRLSVDRDPAMDRTVVRLETDDVPPGPVDDHIDFAPIPGQWTSEAFVVHEDDALSIVLYHPEVADDVAAHIDIDDDQLVLSVRDRRASDPEPYASFGDDPYDARPRGPVGDGLVLDAAFDRGGGDLFVSGYAKAPASSMRVTVNDRATGWPACVKRLVVPSPTHLFGRFEVTCADLPDGTYDLIVGWRGPEGGQWYTETVTVSA